MRGRKPKPRALKVLTGTFRKDRDNALAPEPQTEIPEPPVHLNTAAMAVWNFLAPQLASLRVLTKIDRDGLALYAEATARWEKATGELARTGGEVIVVKTPRGLVRPMLNPWLRVSTDAADSMVRLASEFGLTPASRARLRVTPHSAPDDDDARFFNRRRDP